MKEQNDQINIAAVLHRILGRKRTFAITMGIALLLACGYIFPVPRYYVCSVDLAPEIGDMGQMGGGLSDIASSMGINVGGNMLSDAIMPEFYPKLMKSNSFIVRLIGCPIKTADGSISTNYYTYLRKYQKSNPVMKPIGAIKRLLSKKTKMTPHKHKLDPFHLTKEEDDVFKIIRSKIKCSVDKKTNLITIMVKDQDPVVAATMANQTSEQLKNFISQYRTSKARKDQEYYKGLTDKAKREYEASRRLYGQCADANTDVMLESYKLKLEDLENDMQLKFNNYSALNTQYQAAKAKVQEKTPVFTSVTTASVPLRPAGPKRMIFVIGVLFFTFLGTSVYVSRDLIF